MLKASPHATHHGDGNGFHRKSSHPPQSGVPKPPRFTCGRIRRVSGFTLIEMTIVMSIISILAAIAVPNFIEMRHKAKIAAAISDIKALEHDIMQYREDQGVYPPSLAAVGLDGRIDPWGNAYEYWPVTGEKNQKVRKDRSTHPINTDFDLFSKGRDGDTNLPLTSQTSQDDIIRANNGGYVGLASRY